MKTNTVVYFLLLLLVVSYIVVAKIDTGDPVDMAELVPAEALFYIEQRAPFAALRSYDRSMLGKKVSSIDIEGVIAKTGGAASDGRFLVAAKKMYQKALTSDLAELLAGRKLGFAMIPPTGKIVESTLEDFVKNNTLFLSWPRQNAGFIEFAGKIYGQANDSLPITVSQYGNHHIQRFDLQGEQLAFVSAGGTFVASFNERLLRRSIDCYDKDRLSLRKLETFNLVKRAVRRKGDRFVYLSVDSLRCWLERVTDSHEFSWKPVVTKELETTRGFLSVGYGVKSSGHVVSDMLAVHYDINQVNDITRNHLQKAPGKNSLSSFTTRQTAAYYWSNTVDFYYLLPYLTGGKNSSFQTRTIVSRIEKRSGVALDQMFSYLGNEAVVVVEPGNSDDFITIPLCTLVLDMKEPQKLTSAVKKMVSATGIPVIERRYGPLQYMVWRDAPQNGLQLLCGFWGNRLILGNSVGYLKRIIDHQQGGKTIPQMAMQNGIDPGTRKASNSITYYDNVKIMSMTQRLLSIMAAFVGIEDRELSTKVKVVIDDVVNPLLEGGKMYRKSSSRSYFTPHLVMIESKKTKRQ
ncbi:hypothetical protein [Desulforhopalus singaporensis]|uniref:DUF3352 domain-containing protein n=1 Tax=Desulforhopalus singaporensis TaxID=91360 RepID=A0A1H0QHC6_9BACT|nr:hypothetical protein [Desulforhopalus singaporensis]SDP16742.1 hypothetical protein SAMN05660330_01965 [Desulforhopalus singaporensis]